MSLGSVRAAAGAAIRRADSDEQGELADDRNYGAPLQKVKPLHLYHPAHDPWHDLHSAAGGRF